MVFKMKNNFGKYMNIIIESLNFMIIDYVMMSAILSLKTSIVSVLFSASLFWLFDRFYSTLKELTKNKFISLSILTIIIALECVIVYFTGYLKGSITKW